MAIPGSCGVATRHAFLSPTASGDDLPKINMRLVVFGRVVNLSPPLPLAFSYLFFKKEKLRTLRLLFFYYN